MRVPAPPRRPGGEGDFTRGLVVSACLSAFQDRAGPMTGARLGRVLRHGLQGGTAYVAGSRAAVAAARGDYAGALGATVLGAAGVLLIERLLGRVPSPEPDEERKPDGQGQEA